MDVSATLKPGHMAPPGNALIASRWPQLILGIICMAMIANLQYGWTFFVPGIQKTFGWERAAIQVAFTLFILFETWLVPVEGWLVDRFGPRVVVFAGGLACAAGWAINSVATTLPQFYAAQILAGIGAGAVYGTCIGNALKWFSARRGLAAGLTAAGYGAGSALTVVPIQAMIKSVGFQATFFRFGLVQGAVICLLAFLMFAPAANLRAGSEERAVFSGGRQFLPFDIIGPARAWGVMAAFALLVGLAMWGLGWQLYIPLFLACLIFLGGGTLVCQRGQPVFLLMYVMFVLVGAGGLIVTANLAPIAQDMQVGGISVSLGWLTLPALTFAATLDRTLNGLTRPFFGWVSDKIGRENTMFIAFMLEGIGIFLLYKLGHDPVWFVVLSGMVFFAWGEIYSLFPATCTDTFGAEYASSNAGLLYTAKGTAALLVPYASLIQKASGSWGGVFMIAAGANVLAALLALVVLKPWRQRLTAAYA